MQSLRSKWLQENFYSIIEFKKCGYYIGIYTEDRFLAQNLTSKTINVKKDVYSCSSQP